MEGNLAKPSSNESVTLAAIWLEQLKIALNWAEKHPLKLASGAIALPSLSIYYYLQAEHIPLSILSSDVISGLPSLLAIIAAYTLALFALSLTPLTVMFEGAITEKDGSIRVQASARKERMRKSGLWLLALALPGTILATSVVFMAQHDGIDAWLMPTAIFSSSGLFVLAARRLGRKLPKGKHWLESVWFAAASSLVQMLVAITLMKQVLRLISDLDNVYGILAILIASVILFALLQLLAVGLIERASKGGKIAANVFYTSITLIVVFCAFPTTGAWLAGAVVSGSASGGRSCVQLSISGDKSDFSELMQLGKESQDLTKPLNMLASTSSRYYVRPMQEKDKTFTVPSDRVTQIKKCNDD